ncbi:MAG: 3-methyl-2-oxobutanoate hydroxymethyltransferase [Bdellovibrionales bacterium RIFCSPHIGHO2_01_FULL_40_29]|nr:MAG: 3-methyl-2-oxobutanoate hydroxymethyltransferase [Bdellovibrionales bacterium RIFCSPHIGHO2_01_FULL_40_29]OFZ35100.1 MAG: 3-methyl-2-oxobutanoate hydroxymethyltransferase [Bdellovibrionales bacterium RIFCSPHIGHO2_02_FULL_40_15]
MNTVLDFQKKKVSGQKITMVTCYDYSFAQLIQKTNVDCILVGDSLAQVMHGHPTTLKATAKLMALHTAAVVRGLPNKFVVADMPFLSTRKGLIHAMNCVDLVMKAGAQAIKIEGADGHSELIQHIVESGVPVMGHLGLTPQSIHQLGGPKVQGKKSEQALKIINDARALEKAGCFAVVLECVPAQLAKEITASLKIPTIGIGAGHETDGQVLVLQDMLGMNPDFQPRFLKKYLNGADLIVGALNSYVSDVGSGQFPKKEHSYE